MKKVPKIYAFLGVFSLTVHHFFIFLIRVSRQIIQQSNAKLKMMLAKEKNGKDYYNAFDK